VMAYENTSHFYRIDIGERTFRL